MAERESVLRQFIDGDSIDWQRLTTVLFGIVSASFFGSLAENTMHFFQTVAIQPLTRLGLFLGRFIAVLGDIPEQGVAASWQEATALVADLGVLSFAAAVLLVGTTALIVNQWRRFV